MSRIPNEGGRPSRLRLDRHATGETSLDVSDVSVPDAAAHLAAVEAEKARVPAFDFAAISARAATLDADKAREPRAANRSWALWLVPVLAVAAALLLVVRPPEPPNRTKGLADLDFLVLQNGQAVLGDPEGTYREGDRLQFAYRSAGQDRLLLLSVDGTGYVTVYYPDAGEEPVAIVPGERHVLDGSIILDDAPGPEVFVAFFGERWTRSRARETVERAFAEGGPDALLLLEDDPDVAVLALEKE